LAMNEGIAPGAKNEFDLGEAIQGHELTAVRESGKASDINPCQRSEWCGASWPLFRRD
jgi:hypothetical protein